MAQRQLPRNSGQAERRATSFVMVAVCLMVVGWSASARAEQGLKIRLVNAEEGTWDQRATEIGADVLTPPGESTRPMLITPNALIASDQSGVAEPKVSPSPESLPSSIPIKETPGPSTGDESSQTSLLDQEGLPYQEEPALESYDEQQLFQHRLFGIRRHLLDGQECPIEDPAQENSCDAPELVWRFKPFQRIRHFAPFQRMRFFGSRFLGPSPSREAFDKLFPWNRTPGRNQGVGEPLVNDSWRWAPFGAGWFMGFMDGSTLVTDWTGANAGYFAGYHLNWDFDHYWGTEFRYGLASLPQWANLVLYETETGEHGLPDPRFGKRHATLKYGDFSFLYYPWGDSRWRPYAKAGLGWGYVKFTDLNYKLWSNSTMTMPVGIGLKYRYTRRLVFRMEMVDNFLFGERGINPQHNFSFTAGVEVRFGGTRKAYWPYNPGRHYW